MEITKTRLQQIIKEEMNLLEIEDNPMRQHQEIPVSAVEDATQRVLLKQLAQVVHKQLGADVNLYKTLINSAEFFARTTTDVTAGDFLSNQGAALDEADEGAEVMAAIEDIPDAAREIADDVWKQIENLSGEAISPEALASAVAAILMELS